MTLAAHTHNIMALARYATRDQRRAFATSIVRSKELLEYRQNYLDQVRSMGSFRGQANPYLNISQLPLQKLEELSNDMETSGKSASAQRLRRKYFSKINWANKDVCEVGCGTGVVTRAIAQQPGVNKVLGVDPSDAFLDKARHQDDTGFLCSREDIALPEYATGTALSIPAPDETFDVLVFHEALAHIKSSDIPSALKEAHRVLKPGGVISILENDFPSYNYFTSSSDPLQDVFKSFVAGNVQDAYFVRKLPVMLERNGFAVKMPMKIILDIEQTADLGYAFALKTIDFAVEQDEIGKDFGDALKFELNKRLSNGEFFMTYGHGHCLAKKQ